MNTSPRRWHTSKELKLSQVVSRELCSGQRERQCAGPEAGAAGRSVRERRRRLGKTSNKLTFRLFF